jgi:hypothetical protein
MQSWQIKTLELEQSALKHLDEIIAGHQLLISIGIIYLVIVLGVCLILLLCCGQRKSSHIRPVIFVQLPGQPLPPVDEFNPFPPQCECDCEYDDDW